MLPLTTVIYLALLSSSAAQRSFGRVVMNDALTSYGTDDVCAEDAPQATLSLRQLGLYRSASDQLAECVPPDEVHCAWECHRRRNCTHYNHHVTSRRCDFYDTLPTRCSVRPSCTLFKVSTQLKSTRTVSDVQ